MFNHVGLLGRLAQEPEIRYTQGGTPELFKKVVFEAVRPRGALGFIGPAVIGSDCVQCYLQNVLRVERSLSSSGRPCLQSRSASTLRA